MTMHCRSWNRLGVVVVVLLCLAGELPAAVLTWTGGGDGTSWNNAANWDLNQAPGYYDTLNIATSATIGNVYRDTGTALYSDGYTWRGTVYLNQGTLNLPSYFGTGDNGLFSIGDGVLTGGERDAIVNVGGTWEFDRHGDGTFTLNILRDGVLQGGTFMGYGGHAGRKYVINVDGGLMASSNAWNMGSDATDSNRVNISSHGRVTVGAVTMDDNDVIDFLDRTAEFTAKFGGSFANIAAVQAALGSRFISSASSLPRAVDNGNGTFSVGGLLPPTSGTLPGGFASNASGSGLLYHLDAGVGVTTDGTAVTAWADQGAAGNNFSQADANKQPVLQASGFGDNDLPSIRFDGTADYDLADQLVLGVGTDPRTVVIVNNITARISLGGILGNNNSDYGIRENSTGWQHAVNANDFTYVDSTTQGDLFINGQAVTTVATNTPHILAATRPGSSNYSQTGLGNYFYHTTVGPRPYRGDIAEVLVFDRVLNTAELRILENSLGAKYAIALAANDYYAGDTAANGHYDLSVFGVGRADSGNLVVRAGADGFGIASYDLEDGDWLLAGHKSPTNDWVVDDLPSDGKARWERVWYVDETGSLDSATFAFDFADAGLAEPDSDQPLGLLYSPTNAYEFSIIAQNPDVIDGLVLFDLSGAQLQDGYYTLGVIPEPSAFVLTILTLAALAFRRPSR